MMNNPSRNPSTRNPSTGNPSTGRTIAGRARRLLAAAAVCLAAWGALAAVPSADELAARRAEVAAMSPADQQELLRKQARFAALPAAEQDRLRALQAAIDADPKRDRLIQVATHYHEWLKTLSPGERAKLAEKAPAERIASIEQTVRRQKARREFQRSAELLTRTDMSRILDWIEDILWKHRDKLIADMSPRRKRAYEMENEQQQRRELVRVAIERSRDSDRKNRVEIKAEDIERLKEKLSDKVQVELSKEPDLESSRQLVGRWIVLSMMDRSDFGRFSRRGAPLPKSDMAKFFEEQLPIPKQDELMNMSPEEARQQLREMYFLRERGEWMFRDGHRGPRGERSRGEGSRGDGPRDRPHRDGPPHDGPPPGGPPDGRRGPHREPPDGDDDGPPRKPREEAPRPADAPDEEPPAPVF
ncbi:MAG: hypothetical protein AB7O59_02280 [Pirellulales bacterium]